MTTLRRVLWSGGLVLAIAVVYLGFIFGSRYLRDRSFSEDAARQEAERTRIPDAASGDTLKVTHFYAATPVIEAGQKGSLCYGVLNATSVDIEPQPERIWPALSRCFEVTPSTSTTYRLTATGADGKKAEAEAAIEVK